MKYEILSTIQSPQQKGDMILVPENNTDRSYIRVFSIVLNTEDKLHIRMDKIGIMGNTVKQSSIFKYYYNSKNAVVHDIEPVEQAEWMSQFNSKYDKVKAPHNRHFWKFCGMIDVPIYESANIFITSKAHVYINTPMGWILVDYEWVQERPAVLGIINDEFIYIENLMDLGNILEKINYPHGR